VVRETPFTRNSTLAMLPSGSVAVAARSVVTPTGSEAPAAGAVSETAGAPALTGATVIVESVLGVWLPRVSVATTLIS
jgi:hypothetical protein